MIDRTPSDDKKFTFAITVQVPEGATDGDRYRLDAGC
jgi:hypothetical protein